MHCLKKHMLSKARIFLIVVFHEKIRFRVGGTEKKKKSSENNQMTGRFQFFGALFSFTELFF